MEIRAAKEIDNEGVSDMARALYIKGRRQTALAIAQEVQQLEAVILDLKARLEES